MDHVNIISQEAIIRGIGWPVHIVAALAIVGVLGTLLYFLYTKNFDKTVKGCAIFGVGGLALMVITAAICSIFFKVPTGRFRYEATIDKEQMTVAEYEEFMKAYNHNKCVNGIYYFEDWLE